MTRKKKKAKRSGNDWFTDLLHNIRAGRWADAWLNIWRQQTASRAKASALGKKAYNASRDKNYELAIRYCTEAIALDPLYSYAYEQRARRYLDLERYDEAIADYTEVIELDETALAYHDRGRAYYRMGEDDLAVDDYTQALVLQPRRKGVYIDRMRVNM
ncbi:MAG: tetratricopeptide repeat protein, partial [Chloroflexota bacterium]